MWSGALVHRSASETETSWPTQSDDFAASRPADVLRRGNEWFVDAAAAPDLIAEAAQKNIKVLGLEGFLIDDAGTDPALSRIADFSADAPDVANRRAVALLSGDWATAPSAADQMHNQATGPHMLAVVPDG
jgi:hypothetical protein